MGNKLNQTVSNFKTPRSGLESFIKRSYYEKSLPFSWDESNNGDFIQMDGNNVSNIMQSIWNIAVSNLTLSSKLYDIYKFEMEIVHMSDSLDTSIMLGFIDKMLIKSKAMDYNSSLNVDNRKQFAIGIGNNKYILLYGKYKINDKISRQFEIKRGDKFQLIYNLKKGYIELFYNGAFVDKIFDKMLIKNMELVPAVALKDAQIKVTKSCFV